MLDCERALEHGETPRCVAGMMLPARIIPDLRGSKNSGGFARVVFQEPAKPFTTLQRALALCVVVDRRKEQPIALALMIPLVMKMLYVLAECMLEGGFPKEDYPREAFLLDGAYPALGVGVEIRRPCVG
jgi:hypothetical protein